MYQDLPAALIRAGDLAFALAAAQASPPLSLPDPPVAWGLPGRGVRRNSCAAGSQPGGLPQSSPLPLLQLVHDQERRVHVECVRQTFERLEAYERYQREPKPLSQLTRAQIAAPRGRPP
jgi:hypothetical protein